MRRVAWLAADGRLLLHIDGIDRERDRERGGGKSRFFACTPTCCAAAAAGKQADIVPWIARSRPDNPRRPVVLWQGSLQATTRTTEDIRKWIGLPLFGCLRRTTPRHRSRPPIRCDCEKAAIHLRVLSAECSLLTFSPSEPGCRDVASQRRRDGRLRPPSPPRAARITLACLRNPLLCALSRADKSRSATPRPNRVVRLRKPQPSD